MQSDYILYSHTALIPCLSDNSSYKHNPYCSICLSPSLKGKGHVHFVMLFRHQCLSLGDAETQNNIFKFLKFTKVINKLSKYIEFYIIMVPSICGIAYKHVTRGTDNEAQ